MPFGTAVATCFRKYTDFTGRASRPEFWFFVLFVWLVQLVMYPFAASSIEDYAETGAMSAGMTLMLIVSLVFLLPYLAAAVRRLHDTERSGAMLLLVLIPIIGAIAVLVFLASPGTPGPNRYGPPPGSGDADVWGGAPPQPPIR